MEPEPCNPPTATVVLATDLDGTMIDSGYRFHPQAPRLLEQLQAAGAVVVLATSKTLDEARIYAGRLRLAGSCPGYILLVEEGALLVASNTWLLPPHGRLELAQPLTVEEALHLAPPACREKLEPIQWMSPERVSQLTGLPPEEAEAATRRLYTPALHGPRACLRETMRRALEAGLYARLGRTFLVLGRIHGKGYALRRLLRASPRLWGARVAALGDNEMDAGMLEAADEAYVIPSPAGRGLRLRRMDYLVAPEPAPEGWVWAVKRIIGGHVRFQAGTR